MKRGQVVFLSLFVILGLFALIVVNYLQQLYFDDGNDLQQQSLFNQAKLASSQLLKEGIPSDWHTTTQEVRRVGIMSGGELNPGKLDEVAEIMTGTSTIMTYDELQANLGITDEFAIRIKTADNNLPGGELSRGGEPLVDLLAASEQVQAFTRIISFQGDLIEFTVLVYSSGRESAAGTSGGGGK